MTALSAQRTPCRWCSGLHPEPDNRCHARPSKSERTRIEQDRRLAAALRHQHGAYAPARASVQVDHHLRRAAELSADKHFVAAGDARRTAARLTRAIALLRQWATQDAPAAPPWCPSTDRAARTP